MHPGVQSGDVSGLIGGAGALNKKISGLPPVVDISPRRSTSSDSFVEVLLSSSFQCFTTFSCVQLFLHTFADSTFGIGVRSQTQCQWRLEPITDNNSQCHYVALTFVTSHSKNVTVMLSFAKYDSRCQGLIMAVTLT